MSDTSSTGTGSGPTDPGPEKATDVNEQTQPPTQTEPSGGADAPSGPTDAGAEGEPGADEPREDTSDQDPAEAAKAPAGQAPTPDNPVGGMDESANAPSVLGDRSAAGGRAVSEGGATVPNPNA